MIKAKLLSHWGFLIMLVFGGVCFGQDDYPMESRIIERYNDCLNNKDDLHKRLLTRDQEGVWFHYQSSSPSVFYVNALNDYFELHADTLKKLGGFKKGLTNFPFAFDMRYLQSNAESDSIEEAKRIKYENLPYHPLRDPAVSNYYSTTYSDGTVITIYDKNGVTYTTVNGIIESKSIWRP